MPSLHLHLNFRQTKASCLPVLDPGCLSDQDQAESHPPVSASHRPLLPAGARAVPAFSIKC